MCASSAPRYKYAQRLLSVTVTVTTSALLCKTRDGLWCGDAARRLVGVAVEDRCGDWKMLRERAIGLWGKERAVGFFYWKARPATRDQRPITSQPRLPFRPSLPQLCGRPERECRCKQSGDDSTSLCKCCAMPSSMSTSSTLCAVKAS